jgi:mono/diheme cytochrome c family protein
MKCRIKAIPSTRALALVVLVLALAQFTMAASSTGNPEAGRKIYLESCQSCHGPTGRGDSDMAAYLTPPPANLAAKKTQAKTDAELRKTILEGRAGTAMASYEGTFEEVQLADIIAYIRSLNPYTFDEECHECDQHAPAARRRDRLSDADPCYLSARDTGRVARSLESFAIRVPSDRGPARHAQ